jgi:hypothetical protein
MASCTFAADVSRHELPLGDERSLRSPRPGVARQLGRVDADLPSDLVHCGGGQLVGGHGEAGVQLEELQQQREAQARRAGLVCAQPPVLLEQRRAGDQLLRLPRVARVLLESRSGPGGAAVRLEATSGELARAAVPGGPRRGTAAWAPGGGVAGARRPALAAVAPSCGAPANAPYDEWAREKGAAAPNRMPVTGTAL